MKHIKIEIFEAKGMTNADDLDLLLVELHKKYGNKIMIRKINILEGKISGRGVAKTIKEGGLSALPIIRIDGKISSISGLEELLYK